MWFFMKCLWGRRSARVGSLFVRLESPALDRFRLGVLELGGVDVLLLRRSEGARPPSGDVSLVQCIDPVG
jgi:hypothetical protein